ncbi:hypothetical protein [Actinomadura terrae]|uniref:hypothetical protein n=1 Tax=Actinomadura terrae TaxID=604353 RepID=UPI001FA7B423|nr:hypothetical protein [Actinomadura terrae]
MANERLDGSPQAPHSQTVPAVVGSVVSIGAATTAVLLSIGPEGIIAVAGVVLSSAAITGVIASYIRRRKNHEEITDS